MISVVDARALTRKLCLFATALLLLATQRVSAGPGHDHDHGLAVPAAGATASPRVTAVSENYQLVGIVEGEVLVIYVDRFASNEPVSTATLEVTIGDTPTKAELQSNKTYEVTSALLKKPGSHEVLVSVADGATHDLLVGSVSVPNRNPAVHGFDHGIWAHLDELREELAGAGQKAGWVAGGGLGIVGIALYLAGRRRILAMIFLVLSVVFGTTATFAHEGHDHGAQAGAAVNGNAPQRLSDGTIFLPKPTQRLLEIRTRILEPERHLQAVRFVGRIVANPNRSGVVQSTIAGRYLPPAGGLSLIGAIVKAGDLMGSVAPSFISKDASDMAQTLGELEQQIALARSKLARQENLLGKNVVAEAVVEEIRIQLAGLLKRRKELLAAKIEPEELRAPVDGVVTAVRVTAGQVVSQTDVLFEIIDPESLMVEALVFDQMRADRIENAVSSTSDHIRSKLRFIGRSRALQQQYTVLKFEVLEPSSSLNVGTPVTITGQAGSPVTGIVLPRAAIAQAPNGQLVVFRHREPEIFEPQTVRFEPFGPDSVLISAGLERGDKVVVEGAPLVNQVR
ncbi:MAG: efflux RND transporter periplasmic adaptor subunit [Hyphomicrobiaceae bacterium]